MSDTGSESENPAIQSPAPTSHRPPERAEAPEEGSESENPAIDSPTPKLGRFSPQECFWMKLLPLSVLLFTSEMALACPL